MIWFIIFVVLAIAGVLLVLVRSEQSDTPEDRSLAKTVNVAGYAVLAVSLVFLLFSCLYSQDAGEVVVKRNLGGSIAGSSKEAGFHFKAPWQSTVKYDTRNNVVAYVAKGKEDYDGGSARGNQVTVNDKSGASANIDIQVNYSLDPNYAVDLYKDYGKQDEFVKRVVAVDVRSVPREVSGQFDTIDMLTKRSEFSDEIQKTLEAKWKDKGLKVEQVSVQEMRYPKSITDRYAQAQAADIDRQKAENEQKVAQTEAETKKIKAQGEADANKVLNDSLSDNVLRQHYIDALGNAKELIVTPDGSQTLIAPNK